MTLSEETYRNLKEKLALLEDGAFISARKYASECNVSLTPVREAMLRLTNEGYLKKVTNVGFFKASIDYDSVKDFLESRIMIENFVMPKVVQMITEQDIEYLENLVAEMETSINENSVLKYGESDIKFHCYMIDLYGNKSISSYYRSIREQLGMYSRKNYIDKTTIREHRSFLKLISEKEYEKAVELIVKPLESFMTRLSEGTMRM